MNYLKNLLLIVISPKYGWEHAGKLHVPSQTVLTNFYYRLLALMSASVFVRMLYGSFGIVDAIQAAAVQFASFFAAYLVSNYGLSCFFPAYSKNKDDADRLTSFLVYPLSFLVVVRMINNMLINDADLVKALSLYVILIMVKGYDYLQHKNTVARNRFLVFAIAMVMLLPWLVQVILNGVLILGSQQ